MSNLSLDLSITSLRQSTYEYVNPFFIINPNKKACHLPQQAF